MNWFIKNFKEYGKFDGRARREEYWMFHIFAVIFEFAVLFVGSVFGFIQGFFNSFEAPWVIPVILSIIYGVALIIPKLAVTTRRLHDTGHSGWWYLITLIPFGGIVLFIFLVTDSIPGPNQYGPNPKGVAGIMYTNP